MNKPVNWKALALWLGLGMMLGWTLNTIAVGSAQGEVASTEDKADLSLFWEVWEIMDENYVDTDAIQSDKEVYGAIRGLVSSLGDPYSSFMDPEEAEQFDSDLEGEFSGIGAQLDQRDGQIVIMAPMKGSPAESAGLLPEDVIVLVDDQPVQDQSLEQVISRIRGEQGTSVKLTLMREGTSEPIEKTITRDVITVPSVEWSYKEEAGKTLIVVEISQFGGGTVQAFREAVQEALVKDADGMVIDLRMNGGGYLDDSVEVASEFFKDEVAVVNVRYRDATKNEVLKTRGNGRLPDLPVAILINEGSASASEILAGALQDHGRARLFGVKSFGKGSVQELTRLKDGSTLRLTVAKWFTPNDRTIDHTGIEPDESIPMEFKDLNTDQDIQLNAAVQYLLEQAK